MSLKRNAGLAALLLAITAPAFAQQGTPDPKKQDMRVEHRAMEHEGMPGDMGPRMLSPEIALRMKSELKLTDAQASQLEALRKEIVTDRQARARDMIDIESRVAAGLLSREDVRKQFEGKRDTLRQTFEQRQDRVAKLLTPEQQEQVQRATHHMAMQRMHGRQGGFGQRGFGREMGPGKHRGRMRGRGMEGFGPGMMGPGFGARRPMRPRGPGFDD